MGGYCNNVGNSYSAILGGKRNITGNFCSAMIVGSNITANRDCTAFVNDLSICSFTGSSGCTVGISTNGLLIPVDSEIVYNIIISSFPGNTITTQTQGTYNGKSYSQNGRNVMIDNGTTAITVAATVTNTPTNFIASYTKIGTGNITFTFTGTGFIFITPNGAVIDGGAGSTALLTKNGPTVYLLINNI
jgi:hypothetical protein